MTAIGSPKPDATGRSGKRKTRPGGGRFNEQFAPRTIRMIQSPAFRILSLAARRVLDRLEIELAHHGGKDNGTLPCTFNDLEISGIHRKAIPPAIRELAALGFIEWKPGRAGTGTQRSPSLFRLTYRHTVDDNPSDDWDKITTEEAAKAARTAARRREANK